LEYLEQLIKAAFYAQIPEGEYLFQSYIPYLLEHLETSQQKEAYQTVIQFLDNVHFKEPFSMKMIKWISRKQDPLLRMNAMAEIECQKRELLEDEDQYEKMKVILENYYNNSQKLVFRILYYPTRKMKIQFKIMAIMIFLFQL